MAINSFGPVPLDRSGDRAAPAGRRGRGRLAVGSGHQATRTTLRARHRAGRRPADHRGGRYLVREGRGGDAHGGGICRRRVHGRDPARAGDPGTDRGRPRCPAHRARLHTSGRSPGTSTQRVARGLVVGSAGDRGSGPQRLRPVHGLLSLPGHRSHRRPRRDRPDRSQRCGLCVTRCRRGAIEWQVAPGSANVGSI